MNGTTDRPVHRTPEVVGSVAMILIGCYLVAGVAAFGYGYIGIRYWAWSLFIAAPLALFAYWVMHQHPIDSAKGLIK